MPLEANELQEAMASCGLTLVEQRTLEVFAREEHGLDVRCAPSIVESNVHVTRTQSYDAIIALLGKKLLLEINKGEERRLIANLGQLGVSAATRQALISKVQAFDLIGPPHSTTSMQTLRALLENERETVYLFTGATSVTVFEESLMARANLDRRTVIVVPKRSLLDEDKRLHYDNVMREWAEFLHSGPRKLRTYIRLYVTRREAPHLYTCALTKSYARFDLYLYDMPTTRDGQMIQSPHGSSLYDLVEDACSEAIGESTPLFSVWPLEWFSSRLQWVTIPAIWGLAAWAIVAATGTNLLGYAGGLATSLAANKITAGLPRRTMWTPRRLYKR